MNGGTSARLGALILIATLAQPILAQTTIAPTATTRPAQPAPLGTVLGPIVTASENILRTPYPQQPPAGNSAAVQTHAGALKVESDKRADRINKLVESAFGSYVTVPVLIADVTGSAKTPGLYGITGQFAPVGVPWRSSLAPADQARITELRNKSQKHLASINDTAARDQEIRATQSAVEAIENARPVIEIAFTTSDPKAVQWRRGTVQTVKAVIRQIDVAGYRGGSIKFRFIPTSQVIGYAGDYLETRITLEVDGAAGGPAAPDARTVSTRPAETPAGKSIHAP